MHSSLVFFNKKISVFGYKVVKHLMSWPLNELFKLMMLWTICPSSLIHVYTTIICSKADTICCIPSIVFSFTFVQLLSLLPVFYLWFKVIKNKGKKLFYYVLCTCTLYAFWCCCVYIRCPFVWWLARWISGIIEWMEGNLRFCVLLNRFQSVGQWESDNEKLCAVLPHFPVEKVSGSKKF